MPLIYMNVKFLVFSFDHEHDRLFSIRYWDWVSFSLGYWTRLASKMIAVVSFLGVGGWPFGTPILRFRNKCWYQTFSKISQNKRPKYKEFCCPFYKYSSLVLPTSQYLYIKSIIYVTGWHIRFVITQTSKAQSSVENKKFEIADFFFVHLVLYK